MKKILETDSVLLEFGLRKILTNIYIKLETGKVVGLLGRNGAGKSCLMKVTYGSLSCTSKSVRLNKKTFLSAFKHPECLQYLPQFYFVPGQLKVKRVFSDFELDFDTFLKNFPDFDDKYTIRMRNLSGGQRRLIEVYMMVKSQTDFVLLDEPFSHIMPLHIEKMIQVIEEEKNEKGFLITDHMYRNIIKCSDWMYVLKNGQTYLSQGKNDLNRLGYVNT